MNLRLPGHKVNEMTTQPPWVLCDPFIEKNKKYFSLQGSKFRKMSFLTSGVCSIVNRVLKVIFYFLFMQIRLTSKPWFFDQKSLLRRKKKILKGIVKSWTLSAKKNKVFMVRSFSCLRVQQIESTGTTKQFEVTLFY